MKVKTSKKEQISVVALYSNNETVLEELLHFTPAEGVGRRVALNTHQCVIDKNACKGRCYDGTAVMSGCNHGVQERFREEVLQALYIHCHAHRLNLVLVDVVSNVQQAGQFFDLYNFFSNSVAHNVFMKKQRSGIDCTGRGVEEIVRYTLGMPVYSFVGCKEITPCRSSYTTGYYGSTKCTAENGGQSCKWTD